MVAMNRYYADFMAEYLAVPPERIHVVPPGLNLDGHAPEPPPREVTEDSPRVIGFLSRVCPDKGLHELAEAFKLVAADPQVPLVELHAAGYLDKADRPYLEEIEENLDGAGLAARFRYHGELDRQGKIALLRSLSVLSVPTTWPESKGLAVLEGFANGIPAVLPAHGVFPEMIEQTGGGVLYAPGDRRALADALAQLLRDPQRTAEHGRRAHRAVRENHPATLMAQRMVEVYRRVLANQ
jgi:glycosyltransferase involved in cell wall biosynthesis